MLICSPYAPELVVWYAHPVGVGDVSGFFQIQSIRLVYVLEECPGVAEC